MPPRRRPAPPVRSNRELKRALAVCCGLGLVFSLAVMIGANRGMLPREEPPAASSADDLTTGSIVVVPVLGDSCIQRLIDNRTWQVRELGEMACDELLRAGVGRGSVETRLDAIRDSFRRSPQ